jgi:hypothetical protein
MRPPYGILDMSSRLLLANVKSCAVIYINIYKIRRRRGTPPPAPLLQPKAGGGIGACKPLNDCLDKGEVYLDTFFFSLDEIEGSSTNLLTLD